jgi:hypothetical protein
MELGNLLGQWAVKTVSSRIKRHNILIEIVRLSASCLPRMTIIVVSSDFWGAREFPAFWCPNGQHWSEVQGLSVEAVGETTDPNCERASYIAQKELNF